MSKSCCGVKEIASAYTALLLNENSELAQARLLVCYGDDTHERCEFNRRGFCQGCPTTVKCWVKAKVRGKDQICPKTKW